MKKLILSLMCILLMSCSDIGTSMSEEPENTMRNTVVTQSMETTVVIHEDKEITETRQPTPLEGEIGGYTECRVHPFDYHSYPLEYMEYVGVDNFYQWIKNTNGMGIKQGTENDCIFYTNIYDFIQYFDIPKEDFAEILYDTSLFYTCDYNVDVLYSDDQTIIDDYYRDYRSRREEREKLQTHFEIKLYIRRLFHEDSEYANEELWNKYSNMSMSKWSIPELIYEANIPQEAVENIIADKMYYPPDSLDRVVKRHLFDYDIANIYSNKEVFAKEISDELSPIAIENKIIKNDEIVDGISKYVNNKKNNMSSDETTITDQIN